jgi:hypothetical protein
MLGRCPWIFAAERASDKKPRKQSLFMTDCGSCGLLWVRFGIARGGGQLWDSNQLLTRMHAKQKFESFSARPVRIAPVSNMWGPLVSGPQYLGSTPDRKLASLVDALRTFLVTPRLEV